MSTPPPPQPMNGALKAWLIVALVIIASATGLLAFGVIDPPTWLQALSTAAQGAPR